MTRSLDLILSIVKIRIDTFKKRNKILKTADRHGWYTVHKYLDDPLAGSVNDATTTVFRANRERTANTPDNRGGGSEELNTRDLKLGE